MRRLYFDTPESLANAGATTDIADARAWLATYQEKESAAQLEVNTRQAELAVIQAGRRRIFDLRAEMRAELERISDAAYMATLLECKSVADAGRHAEKHAKHISIDKYLTRTLVGSDSKLVPGAQLRFDIATAALWIERGNKLMCEALILSIARHAAAQQLVEVDGTVVLSSSTSSRAHSAWLVAQDACRRAAESERAVDLEKQRLSALEAVK